MRYFSKEKNQKFQVFFQKNVLGFLSVRYGADFRRFRLVSLYTGRVLGSSDGNAVAAAIVK